MTPAEKILRVGQQMVSTPPKYKQLAQVMAEFFQGYCQVPPGKSEKHGQEE